MKMNIPNALSSMRILLIPFFLYTYLNANSPGDYLLAAGILTLSGLTDTIDGWIARKFNMITQLGQILDPTADKLTLAAVIAALWIERPHLWPLFALFIAKEALMLVGGLRLHRKKVNIQKAQWFGKLATILFYLIMITIVAFPGLSEQVILGMLLVLLASMVFAFLQYAAMFSRLLKNGPHRAE